MATSNGTKIDTKNMIFVFGSNYGGIHGAGAARTAYEKREAQWGVSEGPTGSCYALPTKGILTHMKKTIVGNTLSLVEIKHHVDKFLEYARSNPSVYFQVTRVGCGLAGLRDEDIAPMFVIAREHFDAHVLDNCWFDQTWAKHLPIGANIWGTF